MGLIRAVLEAGGTTLADQWKEYFQVDSMSSDQLVVKAHKITKGKNNRGGDDIISNGSVVAVGDGQVALIVQDGKIVEFCAEPGRFVWDASATPSMFCGGFFKGLVDSFKEFGQRFTFGGDRGRTQRVYFVNTKEIMDNKFGTTTPMMYDDPYYKTVLYIRYFGQFSFRIVDPIKFFTSVSGAVGEVYTKDNMLGMCRDEFMTALDSALAQLSANGIKFSQIPMKQREIAQYMSETLDSEWTGRRGLDVVSVAIAKVTPDDKSKERIEQFDTNVMHAGPEAMAGGLAYAQMQAMQKAAENSAGAMTGFMGMGMMQNAMGNASASQSDLLGAAERMKAEKTEKAAKATPAIGGWKCSCGAENFGKFCADCGSPKPVPVGEWTCKCGSVNYGKFCGNCGSPKPSDEWTCECGSVNKGKFCPNCGKAR